MARNGYDYQSSQSQRDNYNTSQQSLADTYARNQERIQNGDY